MSETYKLLGVAACLFGCVALKNCPDNQHVKIDVGTDTAMEADVSTILDELCAVNHGRILTCSFGEGDLVLHQCDQAFSDRAVSAYEMHEFARAIAEGVNVAGVCKLKP